MPMQISNIMDMGKLRRFLNNVYLGQSSLGLLIVTILGCLLLSLPVLMKIVYAENMNPERKDRLLITIQSMQLRDSLVSNVAVSIPLTADFLLDIITNFLRFKNSANTGRFMRAQLPRLILVASLSIPGLLILCIALPSNYPELLICIFPCRLVAIFYGVFGHLWEEGGKFWRSPWIIFVMTLAVTGIVLAVWDSFSDSGVANIRLIIAILGGYAIVTVTSHINTYSYYNAPFLATYNYVEGAVTVAFMLTQGRLNKYEITMKE
eukprot:gene13826-29410_t